MTCGVDTTTTTTAATTTTTTNATTTTTTTTTTTAFSRFFKVSQGYENHKCIGNEFKYCQHWFPSLLFSFFGIWLKILN